MSDLMDIIKTMLDAFRKEGIDIPAGTEIKVEAAVRAEFGGERPYIKGLPKLQRRVRIETARAAFGTSPAALADIQRITGLPTRTIKRIKNGR